jgi:hypothetical protein
MLLAFEYSVLLDEVEGRSYYGRSLSRIKYVACARVLIHSFWSKEDLRSNVRGLL